MDKNIFFVFSFMLSTLAAYCQDSINRELPPFTALQVTDNITVQLHHGGSESVSIRAEGIDPEQVQTTVENNILKIGLAGIALTDHDSVGGLDEATEEAGKHGSAAQGPAE